MPDPGETLARMFHEKYERLAPEFGYKTREESAVPWDEVPESEPVADGGRLHGDPRRDLPDEVRHGDGPVSEHQRACVVHSKPTEARHGLLCIAHFDRLADMLRQVEEEAAILSAVPSMAIRTGSGGGSLASSGHPHGSTSSCTSTTAAAPARARPTTTNSQPARRCPCSTCCTPGLEWCARKRGFTSQAAVTISGERDVLTRALDWIAEQPWVDEMFNEVRQLVGQLKAANGTQDEKPVGRCYLPPRRASVTGRSGSTTRWATRTAAGATETWTGAQLLLLKEQMELDRIERDRPKTEDGRRMLTAEEMCTELGIRLNAFRVRVHRMRVVSVDGHYDPDLFDVKATA
jgi:hypothetical protein